MIIDLTMDQYIAHPYLGSSTLRQILISPLHFYHYQRMPKTDTSATLFGTLTHTAITQSHLLSEYAFQPEDWGPKNKGDGYTKWNDFKKANAGKIIVGFEEKQGIDRILLAASKNVCLQDILKDAQIEITALDEVNSLKSRSDIIDRHGVVWDLKTTSKGMEDRDLAWTVLKMSYHFQAAHHMSVLGATDGWGWIFVSTDGPAVHIRCFRASDLFLEKGNDDFNRALETYQECLRTREWPGFADEIGILEYPIP